MKPELTIGEWDIDPIEGQIRRAGETRHLRPKAMAVLMCLAEKPGEMFERDDIIQQVWGRELVTDDALRGRLTDRLRDERLVAFTGNAFVMGAFHGAPLKDDVYRPSWSDPERVAYTLGFAELLTAWCGEETELSLSRTGDDVGTPILTFHPGKENEASFFGPVISKAPRGAEALELWDAVEKLATMSGVAELKRSNRIPPDFT